VAAELRRRKDCRSGLRGVRIGLLDDPAGAEYVCDGSGWDRSGKLTLDLVPAGRCVLLSDWPEVCPCWK
jgi:hypothetical protein